MASDSGRRSPASRRPPVHRGRRSQPAGEILADKRGSPRSTGHSCASHARPRRPVRPLSLACLREGVVRAGRAARHPLRRRRLRPVDVLRGGGAPGRLLAPPGVATSALVFAGSAQFAALAVVTGGGTLAAAIAAATLMNGRFLAMGVAIAPSLPGGPVARGLQGQAVVDASWALANRGDGTFDRWLLFGTTLPQYVTWTLGTVAGVYGGSLIGDTDRLGLDAVFPTFFLGLVLAEMRDPRSRVVALLGRPSRWRWCRSPRPASPSWPPRSPPCSAYRRGRSREHLAAHRRLRRHDGADQGRRPGHARRARPAAGLPPGHRLHGPGPPGGPGRHVGLRGRSELPGRAPRRSAWRPEVSCSGAAGPSCSRSWSRWP